MDVLLTMAASYAVGLLIYPTSDGALLNVVVSLWAYAIITLGAAAASVLAEHRRREKGAKVIAILDEMRRAEQAARVNYLASEPAMSLAEFEEAMAAADQGHWAESNSPPLAEIDAARAALQKRCGYHPFGIAPTPLPTLFGDDGQQVIMPKTEPKSLPAGRRVPK